MAIKMTKRTFRRIASMFDFSPKYDANGQLIGAKYIADAALVMTDETTETVADEVIVANEVEVPPLAVAEAAPEVAKAEEPAKPQVETRGIGNAVFVITEETTETVVEEVVTANKVAVPPLAVAEAAPDVAKAKEPAKPRAKRPTKKERDAKAAAEADRLEAERHAKEASSLQLKTANASRRLDEANARKANAEATKLQEEAEALRTSQLVDDATADLIRSEARLTDVKADEERAALNEKLRKERQERRQQKMDDLKFQASIYWSKTKKFFANSGNHARKAAPVWGFAKRTGGATRTTAIKVWPHAKTGLTGLWTGVKLTGNALGKLPEARRAHLRRKYARELYAQRAAERRQALQPAAAAPASATRSRRTRVEQVDPRNVISVERKLIADPFPERVQSRVPFSKKTHLVERGEPSRRGFFRRSR